jgi:hypothetical protein
MFVLVLVGTSVLYQKFFQPQFISGKTEEDYTKLETIRFETSKISDEYLPEGFSKPLSPVEEISENKALRIVSSVLQTHEKSFNINALEDTKFETNIAYFPAWRIYVDGKGIDYEIEGRKIVVPVRAGNHEIRAVYESTRVQKIANLASVIGITLTVIGIIIASRKRLL